jgi:hypothetical protein
MNPEFQRNLYLEFSFARLIGMPLFLTVIFAMTYLADDHQFAAKTANTALGLYGFIILFWGSRQAAESVMDELRNHTWDMQKTSAISPWSLSWGKLLGSTLFNWYGGILCLLVYLLSADATAPIFIVIAYALTVGLLAHSLSLLVSLFALRKKQNFNSSFSYLFVLFLLFSTLGFMNVLDKDSLNSTHWYGTEIDRLFFVLLSLILATGWNLVGIYRLLAQELQMRTLPWVWLSFIGFLVIYSHGLMVGSDLMNQSLDHFALLMLLGFGICVTLVYGLIFIDDNNPMLMRRLWIYAREEKWLRFLEEMPCWMMSIILCLPCCLYLSLFFPPEATDKLHFYPLPVFLLMLRDIGVVLFFCYAPRPKRAFGLSVLYLTFLYWIIPALFMQMGMDIIAAAFLPLFIDNLPMSIVFAVAQAGFVGYLLLNRWQKTVNQLQNNF